MWTFIGLMYLIVFMGVLYFTIDRYSFLTNVLVYVVGRAVIPGIFEGYTIGDIFLLMIVRFIIGLIFIKLMDKLRDGLDQPALYMVVAIVGEFIISRFVVAFLLASILVI